MSGVVELTFYRQRRSQVYHILSMSTSPCRRHPNVFVFGAISYIFNTFHFDSDWILCGRMIVRRRIIKVRGLTSLIEYIERQQSYTQNPTIRIYYFFRSKVNFQPIDFKSWTSILWTCIRLIRRFRIFLSSIWMANYSVDGFTLKMLSWPYNFSPKLIAPQRYMRRESFSNYLC